MMCILYNLDILVFIKELRFLLGKFTKGMKPGRPPLYKYASS